MKSYSAIYILFLGLFSSCFLFAQEKILVMTSLAAQNEAVQAIAGEWVEVKQLLPPNASPETFSPTPKQLTACSNAKVFFAIGIPMEKGLLPKLNKSFPKMTIVHTEKNMIFRHTEEEHHQHHAHGANDPHVWLSIPNMMIHASCIADTLATLLPDQAKLFQQNKDAYLKQLTLLQQDILTTLAPCKGKTIPVFHPAYGYFLDMVGMTQLSVEQNGHAPSAKHLAELQEKMENITCNSLFSQPQSNPVTSEKTAKILGKTLQFLSPLPEHYSDDLRKIANSIRESF